MTLFTATKLSVEQPHLNAVKTTQAAIATQVKQVPEESEITAEKAFVSDVRKTET